MKPNGKERFSLFKCLSATWFSALLCVLGVVVGQRSAAAFHPATDVSLASALTSHGVQCVDGKYVLSSDVSDNDITHVYSGTSIVVDLNGHTLSLNWADGHGEVSGSLEVINSSATPATFEAAKNLEDGGVMTIGSNVKWSQNEGFLRSGGKLVLKAGSMLEGAFSPKEGCEINVEDGCKISGSAKSYCSAFLGGRTLQGPDADGYYIVSPLPQDVVVSESEGELAIDTRTGSRTIMSYGEIRPFAHSMTGWGGGAAAQATITYTFNGGAAQTLGAYADGDVATWAPTKNGTYVFTHQPGGQSASIVLAIPTVALMTVQQRYPWNNIVDYTYELSGLTEGVPYKMAVETTLSGVKVATTNQLTAVADGVYSGQVDLAEQYGNGAKDKSATLELRLLGTK